MLAPRFWEKLWRLLIPSTPWCGGLTGWTRISGGEGKTRSKWKNQALGGVTADQNTDGWIFTIRMMIGDRVFIRKIWRITDYPGKINCDFLGGLHENFNILSNTCSLYKHFPHIFVCFVSGYKNGSLESLTKFHFPFDQTQEFKSSQKSVFCDVTIDKLPLYKLFLHTQTPTRFYLN